MKRIIFTLLLIITGFVVRSQTGSSTGYFHYTFKITGVTDMMQAKEINADLNTLFNIYPEFIDSTDTFDFVSTENITQTTFDNIIVTKNGYPSTPLNTTPSSSLGMQEYLDKLEAE